MIEVIAMSDTDTFIEAVAKSICQSALDENNVAAKAPVCAFSFGRNLDGVDPLWNAFTTDAAAALAAIEAAGFVVVPKEPTSAMLNSGFRARKAVDNAGIVWEAPLSIVYAAMLSARPKVTE